MWPIIPPTDMAKIGSYYHFLPIIVKTIILVVERKHFNKKNNKKG